MLKIQNLKVNIEDKEILKGVDLEIGEGEFHAVLGPNGSGKSTLMQVLAGHPRYQIVEGEVTYGKMDFLQLAPEERAINGIMLCFQYPMTIPGVTVANFLRTAVNEKLETPVNVISFRKTLEEEVEKVGLNKTFLDRFVNDGFSGGEKKKLEMLQLRILKPDLVILDEIDSGLDVDALKIVAKTLQELREESPMFSAIIVTHQRKLLEYISPDTVHVMIDGRVVKSGGDEIVDMVEEKGFAQFE